MIKHIQLDIREPQRVLIKCKICKRELSVSYRKGDNIPDECEDCSINKKRLSANKAIPLSLFNEAMADSHRVGPNWDNVR